MKKQHINYKIGLLMGLLSFSVLLSCAKVVHRLGMGQVVSSLKPSFTKKRRNRNDPRNQNDQFVRSPRMNQLIENQTVSLREIERAYSGANYNSSLRRFLLLGIVGLAILAPPSIFLGYLVYNNYYNYNNQLSTLLLPPNGAPANISNIMLPINTTIPWRAGLDNYAPSPITLKNPSFGQIIHLMSNAKVDAPLMKSWIEAGLDIHQVNAKGTTLLLAACYYGCEDVVKLLLNRGVDVNRADFNGKYTPLIVAICRNHSSIAQALIEYRKVDFDAKDCNHCTAMDYARVLNTWIKSRLKAAGVRLNKNLSRVCKITIREEDIEKSLFL